MFKANFGFTDSGGTSNRRESEHRVNANRWGPVSAHTVTATAMAVAATASAGKWEWGWCMHGIGSSRVWWVNKGANRWMTTRMGMHTATGQQWVNGGASRQEQARAYMQQQVQQHSYGGSSCIGDTSDGGGSESPRMLPSPHLYLFLFPPYPPTTFLPLSLYSLHYFIFIVYIVY